MTRTAWLRTLGASLLLVAMPACTKTGLNAGRQGGLAWIGMAGMLIGIGVAMWYFLGREE
jgi:hypothetical protein